MNSDSIPFQDVVRDEEESNAFSRVGILAAIAGVFVLDSFLTVEVNGFILYLPIIWLAFHTGKSFDLYTTAALSSLMLIIDLYISSLDNIHWIPIVNRLLGISAIWLTAGLCGQVLRTRRSLLSRERYRSIIVETALDAVVSIDKRGRIVDWNAQAENTFGWSRTEVVGRELASLIIPPEQRAAHRRGLARHLHSGFGPILGQRLEMTALRKSGEEFPIELSVVEVPLDGKVLFNAFLRDISGNAENAMYRARLAALVDSSYDAIIGLDVDGKIISWNWGAERVYGYREEEAIGKTIDFLMPSGSEEQTDIISEAIRSGRRLEQFETFRKTKGGRLVSVSLTVSPIANENGVDIGTSTIERDISDLKRQQRELFEAKEEAEKANQVRAEFLANVSHELRTPMNAIIGMTQIALGEDLTEDVRDYVQTANDSAHSLLTLLNDILDFSKLESGKFTIDEEPFSLRSMLDEAIKPLSIRAFEKGLELACDIPADVPDELVGDAVRIKQILTNLISNAVKFTDEGEVVVSVKPLKISPQKVRLQFSVKDTGVGIQPEDQVRILEPFTQVDASSTRRHGGTGLGLAISNQLLRLMRGKLTVESELSKWSCLSFKLNLKRQSLEEQSHADGVSLQELRDLPVLIVDDNETNRRILSSMLQNWSMKPDLAENAEQALRRFDSSQRQGDPFPLVIVDALMPGMDGYTLSQRIHERSPNPPPVILMISSSDRLEFKKRGAESDISVFLQKPVTQSDLMDAVMQAMEVHVESESVEAQQNEQPEPHQSLSILLAEDTPANQKVVSAILKKSGHQVTIAYNGQEALDLHRQKNFDVILMDVQMPVMDGYRATAAIRDYEKSTDSAVPIIAMTAHVMRGDRERCLAAGMDAYLAKPVDVDEMLQVVEEASQGRECLRGHRSGNGEEDSAEFVIPDLDDSTSENASPEEILDFEGVMKRLNGELELYRDFIKYFDEDYPPLIDSLQQAIGKDDASAVHRIAHSLKGLCANLGAVACTDTAGELEQIGKDGDLNDASNQFAKLQRQISQLDAVLGKYRK